MAFLGKLFEKKVCSICGSEIKLLGNRKLEDGNLCKVCAGKLSPWFEERRSSTVEQIREQLLYREENQEKVERIRVTRTLGETVKVLLDEDAGQFMVTDRRDWKKENPDVLTFSDVTGCIVDIEENCTELMITDKDGNESSYRPPRYQYEYDFYVTIHVRNPYFDEIRFKVNDSTVESQPTVGAANLLRNMEYQRYKKMSEEIKDALLNGRKLAREEEIAAAAPKMPVICPYCGAQTLPDTQGCCEYCRSVIAGN